MKHLTKTFLAAALLLSALTACGTELSLEAVMAELRKDGHYYTQSGGGITLSGGECLLYPEFVRTVAGKCREQCIHCAVESAFAVSWKNVEAVLPYIDLFYADIKALR